MTRLGQLGLDLVLVGIAVCPAVYGREGVDGVVAALTWGWSAALAWSFWQPREEDRVKAFARSLPSPRAESSGSSSWLPVRRMPERGDAGSA